MLSWKYIAMTSLPFGSGAATAQFWAGSHSAVAGIYERNTEASLYVANLDSKTDEELLWELFLQCGPLASIHLPKERVSGSHQGFGFVEFKSVKDAEYALRVLNMVKMFGKPMRLTKGKPPTSEAGVKQPAQSSETGANLFVGSLSKEVDERSLQELFGQFGVVSFCKIVRNTETGESKGFGFVTFTNFQDSDRALASLNGQFFAGSPISVSYSVRKEGRGHRHGSAPERLISQLTKNDH